MATTVYKTTSSLTIMYKKNSILSGVVAILSKDTFIDVVSTSNGWASCIYNSKTGYIQSSKLQLVTGSISINYVDENNVTISPPKVYSNLPLGTYTYSAITIPDYTLTSESPQSVTLSKSNLTATIVFKYKKNVILGSVTIAYIDKDANIKIITSDIYTNLPLTQYTYNAKEFNGYELVGNTTQSVTLTATEKDKVIIFYYKSIGSIGIAYIDQENNIKISPNDIYTNLSLGLYTYNAKAFDEYTLIGDSSQTVTLTSSERDKVIIFYYKKIVKGSVTVSYIDEDTNLKLADDDIYADLTLGVYTYSAKNFDGYICVSESNATVTLTEINKDQVVMFYYVTTATIDETELPYISIYYYNPKPTDAEQVIIPLYFTDFYQKEYYDGDTSLRFNLRYEIDGVVNYINNLPAGDYNLNLGLLTEGMHWYSAQVIDVYGRVSRRIFNDLWVINEANYAIKPTEIYTITDADLATYKINKNNSQVETDMINNRVGLSQLFADLRAKGIRKVILPLGIYRVNRCLRQGTIAAKTCPIIIPSNLTIDMNGATFKLHPYDDRQYGTLAQVENLIVRMSSCKDSHLINGTIEGDFFERQNLIWTDGSNAISGSNGEQSNGVYMYGAEFSTLTNITIKQVTGYNVCAGQDGSYGWGKIGSWTDGLSIENGVEVSETGYTTCSYCTMDDSMLANKYVVASVWLGYGGLNGLYWDMNFHFYDVNNKFIETIKVYQFTRCRIPSNAKTLRMTFRGAATDVTNLSLHHMKSTRYSSINNCNWIDNRTCSAPFQFQHLAYNNCKFTRSGQSITPCEIDVEDGWEQAQDLFVRGCEIFKNAGTADIIANAGINHVMENCKSMSILYRYRINGIIIRNNENIGIDSTIGWMTGNTIKIYANNINSVRLGQTELQFFNYEKTKVKIKNNTATINYIDRGKEFYSFDNNIVTMNGSNSKYNMINGTIYVKGTTSYISGDVYVENCTFKLTLGETYSKFSFNALNVSRLYTNCIYQCPCQFVNHNYFNSGSWNDCSFNDILLMSTDQINNIGDISFTNCTFNKDVTIDLGINANVQFNNCTFIGTRIFKNSGQINSQFNNCIFN
ncbi:MAG: MucBP domain-containing protein [Clostridium sp.]|uniref:MucBP domain-containing protein n=1 Tax=Clostridium sp. TaxID=1506 RepID=UPI0030516583